VKWKLWWRKQSLSAPRVTVRSDLTWSARAVLMFLFLAGAVAAGFAMYEFGRSISGPGRKELLQQVDQLQTQLRQASSERDRYLAQSVSLESELKVQKAAQEQLVQQVSALEADQEKLKEDLSFFESLLPAGKGDKGIAIRSFRLQPDPATGQLTYRLLVQQSGKPTHDFTGSAQLRVFFVQNGRSFTLDIPNPAQGATAARDLALSFHYYQRLEGPVPLPAGAVAKSVQVRIYGGTELKLQQSFNL
jgi:hypothetical protein